MVAWVRTFIRTVLEFGLKRNGSSRHRERKCRLQYEGNTNLSWRIAMANSFTWKVFGLNSGAIRIPFFQRPGHDRFALGGEPDDFARRDNLSKVVSNSCFLVLPWG
jgi:hypothetical protein